MTTLKKRLTLCLAVLSFTSVFFVASAEEHQWNDCKDPATKEACMHTQMDKHIAEHEARLHDELKLTAAQEPAWKSFTDSMHQQRLAMEADHQAHRAAPSHADMENMSAPDKLEHHLAMMQKHLTAMQAHLTALKSFYTVLTPEQQTIMNKEIRRFAHHRHHHCHHHFFHHNDIDHEQQPGK